MTIPTKVAGAGLQMRAIILQINNCPQGVILHRCTARPLTPRFQSDSPGIARALPRAFLGLKSRPSPPMIRPAIDGFGASTTVSVTGRSLASTTTASSVFWGRRSLG